MLVLSRHVSEEIVICTDPLITIMVVELRGDKVRLGINAPANIPVHRREVYDALKREEEKVAQQEQDDGDGTGPNQAGK
jgi:carbon storage regulator